MAIQAVKVKNEESQSSAITGAASGVGEKVSDAVKNSSEFLHDVRVEMKQVTWPGREEVTSTTGVVIVTVFFFAAFLAAVDWLAQLGVQRILKIFGV